ncbi:MAG TPA: GNAT family N-acetyltransferase [Candidatus Saccharimonadales bacterium]|nr:GNAT family N-acetyltransferase [Candidatus Saccharimonadales bacterium]
MTIEKERPVSAGAADFFDVRLASMADAPAIEDFYQALPDGHRWLRFGGLASNCPINVDQLQEKEDILLAQLTHSALQEIVGFADYHTTNEPATTELAVVVSPDHCNKGCGSLLVRRAIEHALADGYTYGCIDTAPQNTAALALSTRMLGRPISKVPGELGGWQYTYDLRQIGGR